MAVALASLTSTTAQAPEVLVIGAGVSRGAYQAGVTYAHVHGDIVASKERFLRVSTVSSGALNGLLGAIESCLEPPPTAKSPLDSRLWKAWAGFQWRDTFPDEGSSLMSFEPVRASVDELMTLVREGKGFVRGCTAWIAISLLSDTPHTYNLGADRISTYRRAAYIRMEVQEEGVRFYSMYPKDERNEQHIPVLRYPISRLLEEGAPEISFSDVLTLVAASASAPHLMDPQRVQVCYADTESSAPVRGCPAGQSLRTERLSDGGLFDQVPVSGALFLLGRGTGKEAGEALIVPVSLRSRAESSEWALERAIGTRFYGALIPELLNIARDAELQTLERNGRIALRKGEREGPVPLTSIPRPRLIAGDRLFNFGAFMSERLRKYDFFRGILSWVEWKAASDAKEGETCRDRVKKMDGLLKTLGAEHTPELVGLYIELVLARVAADDRTCRASSEYTLQLAFIRAAGYMWPARVHRALEEAARDPLFDELTRVKVLSDELNQLDHDWEPAIADFRDWWHRERLRLLARATEVFGDDSTVEAALDGMSLLMSMERHQPRGWSIGSRHAPVTKLIQAPLLILPESFGWSIRGESQVRWRLLTGSERLMTDETLEPLWLHFYVGSIFTWRRQNRDDDDIQWGPSLGLGLQYELPGFAGRVLNGEIGVRGFGTLVFSHPEMIPQDNPFRLGIEGYVRVVGGWLEVSFGRRTQVLDDLDLRRPFSYVAISVNRFDGLLTWLGRVAL